jgi:NAD(P)-dependent dehydrogenase (short-subunit alcohol dehydrogenase family)
MIAMDGGDDASVTAGMAYNMEQEGRLDIVVNNAGMGVAGALENTTVEELKAQFATNFFGIFRVSTKALPSMRVRGSGLSINIGSIAGVIGIPFQGAYSASKFALGGLSDVMCMEAKPFGVDCVLAEPGDCRTGFTDHRRKTEMSKADTPYS